MSNFFPADLSELAGGPGRAVYAPVTEPVPTRLNSISLQTDPYTLQGAWEDFGATSGAPQVSRNFATGGFTIQQVQGTVLDEITEVTRTIAVPVAAHTPEILAMLEESSGVTTVASGTGYNSAKKIPFGSIFDLSQYRIALLYQFKKRAGNLVTETSTGKTRGRIAAWVGLNATLTADNAQLSVGAGEMTSVTLTFKLDNDPTITAEGSEQGFWIIEDAGTIA